MKWRGGGEEEREVGEKKEAVKKGNQNPSAKEIKRIVHKNTKKRGPD